MSRRDDHPARFVLEQLHAGELSPTQRESIRVHLDQCPACRAYVDHLNQQREQLLEVMSPDRLLVRLPPEAVALDARRPRWFSGWQRPRLALAMATVATAILVWAVVGSFSTPSERPGVRLMGAPAVRVSVLRQRDGQVSELSDEADIRVGDALRFQLQLSEPMFVAVMGVAATGRVQPLIPPSMDDPPLACSGVSVLPGSVRIEPGGPSSRLLLVARPEAFALDGLVRAIEQAVAGSDIRSGRGAPVEGVAYSLLVDVSSADPP